MATFPLKVMTVEQCCFDGEVDRIIVRTTQGDVGILPNHVPYIAALGIGGLTVFQNGSKRTAMIAGGFVEVSAEGAVLLTRTCEWADEIDVNAAKEAAEQARKALQGQLSGAARENAQAELKKAATRIRIAGEK